MIANFNQLGIYQSMKELNLILSSAQLEKNMSELFEKDKSVISSKYVKNIFTLGGNDDEDHKIGHQQNSQIAFHEYAIRIMVYSDFGNKENVIDVIFFLFAFKYKVGDLPQ